MSKLSFAHSVIIKGNNGTRSEQQLEIVVDYNPYDDSIDDVEIYVSEHGRRVCEISKLLDKAEGDPLPDMLAAIDWRELWRDSRIGDACEHEEV